MGIYTASFTGVAVTQDQDLFEIVAGDYPVVIRRIEIGQYSDAGDAQAEMRPISIKRGTTAGSGGTSGVTLTKQRSSMPAASTVVDTNHDTPGTGGEVWWSAAFNVMGGWFYPFTHIPSLQYPKEFGNLILDPGERATVTMATDPGDELTMSGSVEIEELR